MRKQFLGLIFCITVVGNLYATATLEALNGQSFSVSELKGKWIFINYWASWCQTCLDEIPAFNRFYEQYKNKRVALFAVNYDTLSVQTQKKLVRDLNIHYPALKEDPARVLQLGDIRAVPVTFVLDPRGKLAHTLYGRQSVQSLKRALLEYER